MARNRSSVAGPLANHMRLRLKLVRTHIVSSPGLPFLHNMSVNDVGYRSPRHFNDPISVQSFPASLHEYLCAQTYRQLIRSGLDGRSRASQDNLCLAS